MEEKEMGGQRVRLSGLWKRKGKNNVEYWAGRMSPTSTLMVFPARDRRPGKPDYIAFIGETSAEDSESDIKPGVENLSGDPT